MADNMLSMAADTREFERAMAELANESDRSDTEIVTFNGRTLIRSLVHNTPRDTGNTRAGFWPAWEALEMAGTPGTRRRFGEWSTDYRGRKLTSAGTVDDRRDKQGEQSIGWVVKSYLIDAKGKIVPYPYVLNAKKDFWGAGLREASFKFGRTYERLLRKHGKA